MVVGILLMIDVAIMTTWQVTDPFFRETKQMESYVGFKNKFPHPLFIHHGCGFYFFHHQHATRAIKLFIFTVDWKRIFHLDFCMPGIDIFTRMAPTPLYWIYFQRRRGCKIWLYESRPGVIKFDNMILILCPNKSEWNSQKSWICFVFRTECNVVTKSCCWMILLIWMSARKFLINFLLHKNNHHQ